MVLNEKEKKTHGFNFVLNRKPAGVTTKYQLTLSGPSLLESLRGFLNSTVMGMVEFKDNHYLKFLISLLLSDSLAVLNGDVEQTVSVLSIHILCDTKFCCNAKHRIH